MIPYLLVLLVPCIFALFSGRKVSMPLWISTFLLYVTFVGLRFEVGPDWFQYLFIHKFISNENVSDIILRPEPLSYLLFWISENSGLHMYLTNMVGAFMMILGVFTFARRTSNPWIAIVAATPYFILITGMSGVRQAMAAGIVLFLLSRWEHFSLPRRGIYILIAALFHTSALVNNTLLIAKLNIPLRYKVFIGSAILLLTFYLSSEVAMYADSVTLYKQRYLNESEFVRSFGSLYHIAMIAIPTALGLFYKKRITPYIHSPALLNFSLYASLSVLAINFISTTVASRITIYLYFIPMMIYPALVETFGRRSRQMIAFAIVAFHILILVTWLSLGNVSASYIPYNNVLFDD